MIKILWIVSAFLLISHVHSKTNPNPLMVYYKVTNTAQTPVRVFKDQSPLEGIIQGDFITVKFQGQNLERRTRYPWIDCRRFTLGLPVVSEASFALLNPGETMTASIDLADHFDMTQVGTYHVEIVPSEQFKIQNLLKNGELVIEECKDEQIKRLKDRRRELMYSVCRMVEKEPSQGEFLKAFIDMPKSPIELPSFLTLDPAEEQIKNEPSSLGNGVPLFGTIGSASLEINITPDNIPHSRVVAKNLAITCCNHHNKYRLSDDEELSFLSEEARKEFEELECPGFSIWKYRGVINDGVQKAKQEIIEDMKDFGREIDKVLKRIRSLW